jgi:hypothetical protein
MRAAHEKSSAMTDGPRSFSPPFSGDAVLYQHASKRSEGVARSATGPLRRNPADPRYFTDGTGKAIYHGKTLALRNARLLRQKVQTFSLQLFECQSPMIRSWVVSFFF